MATDSDLWECKRCGLPLSRCRCSGYPRMRVAGEVAGLGAGESDGEETNGSSGGSGGSSGIFRVIRAYASLR